MTKKVKKASLPQVDYQEDIHKLRFTDRYITPGSFARVNWGAVANFPAPKGVWITGSFLHCRDSFQRYSHGITRLAFSHGGGQGPGIAAFIGKIEQMLGLSHRSVFGATSRRTVTWIQVPLWWTDNHMRRSLFTALLRAGRSYDPKSDNFERALWSVRYLVNTKEAVERFLAGYARYTGSLSGWYDEFYYGREDQETKETQRIERLLVKPPQRKRK